MLYCQSYRAAEPIGLASMLTPVARIAALVALQ